MPEVSVIIPNYNHASFLRQRIDSVLGQTLEDIEVIILDDCSTDNSREIIDEYRDNKKIVSVIYNEKNSGSAFQQWKKGIEAACGKYIWVAESDDYSSPDFLEKMTKLVSEPGVKLAFCHTQYIDSEGGLKRTYDFDSANGFVSQHDWIADGKLFCSSFFCRHNVFLNASAVIFEKELYKKVGGVKPEYKICSDWLLWWDMACQSKVGYCSEILNFYRIHEENTSSKWLTELEPSYRYFLSHWPGHSGKAAFREHIRNFAIELIRSGKEETGWRIAKLNGFFAAVAIRVSLRKLNKQ